MPMIVWRAHLCRREGVNPDELLGWCNFTEDGWGCPELFLVVSGGKALEHLIEAGYDLGPSMGYCIKVPMHASGGRSGEDGTPLPVVWGNFSMLMWASAFGQPVAVKSLLHLGLLVFILRHDFRLPPWNTLPWFVALVGQALARTIWSSDNVLHCCAPVWNVPACPEVTTCRSISYKESKRAVGGRAGMDPNFQPTPKNSWVPTAISAALNSHFIVPHFSKVLVSDQAKVWWFCPCL